MDANSLDDRSRATSDGAGKRSSPLISGTGEGKANHYLLSVAHVRCSGTGANRSSSVHGGGDGTGTAGVAIVSSSTVLHVSAVKSYTHRSTGTNIAICPKEAKNHSRRGRRLDSEGRPTVADGRVEAGVAATATSGKLSVAENAGRRDSSGVAVSDPKVATVAEE